MGEILIFQTGRRLSPDLVNGPRPAPPSPLPDPSEAFEGYRAAFWTWQATSTKTAESALRYSHWTFEYAFAGVEGTSQ